MKRLIIAVILSVTFLFSFICTNGLSTVDYAMADGDGGSE